MPKRNGWHVARHSAWLRHFSILQYGPWLHALAGNCACTQEGQKLKYRWGFPVWGLHKKDYRILGSILGFPYFGKPGLRRNAPTHPAYWSNESVIAVKPPGWRTLTLSVTMLAVSIIDMILMTMINTILMTNIATTFFLLLQGFATKAG